MGYIMETDYMKIFNNIFYDVKQDEKMNELLEDICKLIGSIIVKYGEILNEIQYKESSDDGFVDTVLILFVRKVMEHLDAINILVEKCCFSQAEIILRTLLETIVSLKFILKEDTEKRAAYYLYHHYEEIEKMKYFDDRTDEGKVLKSNMGEERFKETFEKCKKKKEAFERLIKKKSIFIEIDKLRNRKIKAKKKQHKKPYIQWYEMCSNISSVYGLVKSSGWEKYYEILYGGMSMEAHGYNAAIEIIPDGEGLYLKALRNPLKGFSLIENTGTFSISALKDIYEYLNDGEEEKREFARYYEEYKKRREEFKNRFNELVRVGGIDDKI